MTKKRFEISRLLSGRYALRVFPPEGEAAEHELIPVVGRTIGSFASLDEARLVASAHVRRAEAYEIVVR